MEFGFVHYFACRKTSKSRFTGHNLGLQVLGYSVLWAGISGMRWDDLVPIVHSTSDLPIFAACVVAPIRKECVL
jgi:hypothetical protein